VTRICFVANDFAGVIRNGGIGTHFLLMSRLLVQRGWDVHVLFCGQADDEAAVMSAPVRLAREGISFMRLDEAPAPAWHDTPHFGDGMGMLVASQCAFEALEALHARHPFDIIEFSDWGALGFRAVQAKRSGLAFADTRLAVKLHSTTEWQRRGNLSCRRSPWDLKMEYCERYAFENADLQLSPSKYMLADTREVGWHVREDAVVAYPFPDREENSSRHDGDVKELAFFGRLERRKGLDLFLDALDAMPDVLPVLFLGRDSVIDGRNATEIIADRMAGRPHRVETGLDREAAITELLQGNRLAVMASQSETFGFTVAECIANEIPFLAARAGSIPEVVAHEEGRKRWLFEPTAESLAAALQQRLASPAEEESMLRSAVAAACDPSAWNGRVEEIYRDLAARPLATARVQAPTFATVAVAVTHYNHHGYLPAALASLAGQTRTPDEVFVIDDGSTEIRARRVFEEQAVKYPDWTFLRQRNAGPGAARNRCLAESTSTHFLPFDSDNIADSALVETLLVAAGDGRDAATCHMLAFTDVEDIAAQRFAFRFAPTGGPRLLTVVENVFGDTCGMFRTEALRAVGGFETERWSPHEDWETYTKLAYSGYRVDVVPRVLVYYRTKVGGRLEGLTADPARAFRLRRRMVHDLLADAELSRTERIAMWECLVGFAEPSYQVQAVQRSHDELAAWARQTLADADAWRESQLEDLRSWLTAKVETATVRAERAETELAHIRGRSLAPAPLADGRSATRVAVRKVLGDVLGEQRAARTVLKIRRTIERGRSL
jgi:glycosyltransferase involved in cell wall biosynthesis/GT2 family glycosyltransferase